MDDVFGSHWYIFVLIFAVLLFLICFKVVQCAIPYLNRKRQRRSSSLVRPIGSSDNFLSSSYHMDDNSAVNPFKNPQETGGGVDGGTIHIENEGENKKVEGNNQGKAEEPKP